MSRTGAGTKAAVYLLFAVSGFAGLIYESIWAQYLKLMLGHAAYAQTLVLVIFLGGMALGAWLAAATSRRISSPLVAYACIEAALGVAGLAFDRSFQFAQAWMFDVLAAQHHGPGLVDLLRWGLGGLLILPQSILLGATFPLISAGLLRIYPELPGRALGWLYFTNSFGAALGVLASGFYLIDRVGLPGTILTAALLNMLVALGTYLLLRGKRLLSLELARAGDGGVLGPMDAQARVLLFAAALTGMASFFYEIGWIRMLSLVLGSATHSFELMLSAFILGLAMGSLYIRRRIDAMRNPMAWLGWIQVVMGLLAALSLPLYMQSFDLMAGMLAALNRNDAGYLVFNVFSHAICLLLMLPATFCAGMTLPLITAVLLQSGHGERSIGRVYAFNTFGAILGILLAVHVAMPVFGLESVVAIGAAADILVGLWLLGRVSVPGARRHWMGALVLAIVAAIVPIATTFDPAVTASGVFRHGKPRVDGAVLYYRDGKTATVSVSKIEDTVSIATNGKIDAGIRVDDRPSSDEYTMILLAMAPLAFHPRAQTAAVIGMGSGLTTHALLASPHLRMVDTIEIEPAMVEGARHYGERVQRAFDDPRSHVRIEDAKAYFRRTGRRYDLIISEPSNPWVSGVASLFSQEFYEQTRRHLGGGGLFVQWMHLYEIDIALVASVFGAMGDSFMDYAVFATNIGDLLIVASPDRPLPPMSAEVFEGPDFASFGERLNIEGLRNLHLRKLGGKATLQPYFRSMGVPANSDYFPILDQRAARFRFTNATALEILDIYAYSRRLEGDRASASERTRFAAEWSPVPDLPVQARLTTVRLLDKAGDPQAMKAGRNRIADEYAGRLQVAGPCADAVLREVWMPAVRDYVLIHAPHLQQDLGIEAAERLERSACYQRLNEGERLWLALLRAIVSSAWEAARSIVPTLLSSSGDNGQSRHRLMAELLLADIKAAGPKAASERLKALGGELPDSAPIRYLRAHIAAQNSVATSGQKDRR